MTLARWIFVFCLLVAALHGAVTTAQPTESASSQAEEPFASGEATAATVAELEAEFRERLAEFDQVRQENLQLLQNIRDIESEDERRTLVYESQQRSMAALKALLSAAERFYVANPDNADVAQYLAAVAIKSLKQELMEDAAHYSILLLDHGYDPGALALVAGRACLELGRLPEAREYLELALEHGRDLSQISNRFLAEYDQMEPIIAAELAKREAESAADDLPRVLLETTRGEILIELFENEIPNAVANFVFLVESGFYDDTTFYHVRPGYFAAGGCRKGDGTGTAGYSIVREPWHHAASEPRALSEMIKASDAAAATQRHTRTPTRGTVSMVMMDQWTCSCQFMICYRTSTALSIADSQQPIGRVLEGMDVATRLFSANPRISPEGTQRDRVVKATVVRRRDHAYRPVTATELLHDITAHGLELARKGELEDASNLIWIGLELSPKNPDALFAMGVCLNLKKEHGGATVYLQRLLRIQPDYTEGYYELGNALIALDQVLIAEELYRRMVENLPDEARAHNNLGVVLMKQAKLKQAAECFQTALRLDPDYETARANLNLIRQQGF